MLFQLCPGTWVRKEEVKIIGYTLVRGSNDSKYETFVEMDGGRKITLGTYDNAVAAISLADEIGKKITVGEA